MFFARSENESGQRQLLADHLRNVGQLAGQFAEEAGLPREMGEWAGWLHDLGKYSQEFQTHLLKKDRDLVEHAAHGAAVAVSAGAVECAFAIAAHHGGLGTKLDMSQLTTRPELTSTLSEPKPRVSVRAQEFRRLAEEDAGITGQPSRTLMRRGDETKVELRTRLLLSCVADADRLDAERWMSQWKSDLRFEAEPLDPAGRLEHTLAHIGTIAGPKPESVVKAARASVLRHALARAADAPGFFSLTVPTGGGKTLASLAFGLEHARRHGHRRLIYVLPFLTIIEQNAAVIRAAVGETDANAGRVVLEHHSNVVFERDDEQKPIGEMRQTIDEVRQRLLAENWDAPVVVTTTVQFFESLFAAHPSAVRKIHNIPRSVIVLDEAQTFPPGMLRPIVAMLRQLVDEYGCTVLFTTATQPALSQPLRGKDRPEPLLEPGMLREIVTDPPALFRHLKRVDVAWPGPDPTPMAGVAASMAAARQALAIVNTKQQARDLWEALREHDEGAIHLSTRMCAAHRRTVFAEVCRRLAAGEACLVASTQLIEAGVDVDFPAVWRALGPLEGVAQAAGRCNREGTLATGHVTVFRTEDGRLPGGAYASATKVTAGMLKSGTEPDIDDPGTFEDYFRRLYNVENLDKAQIAETRKTYDFPQTADRFRIIDEATVGVLVPYGEGAAWIARILASDELSRGQLRRLQPYTVALYPHELQQGRHSGEIRLHPKTGMHIFGGEYDDSLGLLLRGGALQD